MILERLPIDGLDLTLGPGALIEALATLIAQPSAIQHALEESGHLKTLAPGVVGHGVIEVRIDVRPDVEAHQIAETEGSRIRQADQRAGEHVHFLNGVVALLHVLVDGGAEEAADAVGDEVGRVLADHDALAEALIAVADNVLQEEGIGIRPRNHFE